MTVPALTPTAASAAAGGQPAFGQRRWPIATLALFLPTLICTLIARNGFPELRYAVQRDPAGLADGEVWRLVSPVLVQAPDPVFWTVILFGLVVVTYWLLERAWGSITLVLAALAGAIPAEIIGNWWAPGRGGTSVAMLGALSVLCVLTWRSGGRVWPLFLLVPYMTFAFVTHDLHGASVAGGLIAGMLIPLRRR